MVVRAYCLNGPSHSPKGIKVSVATIGRFALEYSEEIAELRSIRIEEALRHHQEARAHHNIYFTAEVDDTTTNALRAQALLLATQGGLTPQDLQRLTRTCLNLRKLQPRNPLKPTSSSQNNPKTQ